eukprot:TRINITY_DN17691_c0_g1_i1.p1 TRINITY_DN17691_c0_g1~~TRINITY_DN17691_c0_g1_i1.p1  ORF type:complete len:485 (+),score=100.30 TRINITY_DN17691_c0_g1_i1:163-1617(+)
MMGRRDSAVMRPNTFSTLMPPGQGQLGGSMRQLPSMSSMHVLNQIPAAGPFSPNACSPSAASPSSASPFSHWGAASSPEASPANQSQSDLLETQNAHLEGVACQKLIGRPIEQVRQMLQVVSLGSYCGVKMSTRRLGLGEATLPFDWIRSRVEGIMYWLQNGFGTFFHVQRRLDVNHQGHDATIFRSNVHSFWHDDIDDPKEREKLWRRVHRLESFGEGSGDMRPLLFVRVMAGTQELRQTEALHRCLKKKFGRFGRRVVLLLIIDDQPILGPCRVEQQPDLLLWFQPLFQGALQLDEPSPFEDAVALGVRYVLGDTVTEQHKWPTVPDVVGMMAPNSTARQAGLKDTGAGLVAGNVIMRATHKEVMLAAFEGLEAYEPDMPPAQQPPAQQLPAQQPQALQAQPRQPPPAAHHRRPSWHQAQPGSQRILPQSPGGYQPAMQGFPQGFGSFGSSVSSLPVGHGSFFQSPAATSLSRSPPQMVYAR